MNFKLVAAMMMIPVVSLADGGREKSAAALFNEYCLTKIPDFSSLSARAAAENLKVELDRDIPMPNGGVMKQKNWLIPSFGKAPLKLTAGDVINGELQVVGCGIYVDDGNGEAMEAALSGLPRMAEPIRRSKSNDGAAVIWWRAQVGESLPSEKSEVMLSSGVPGLPGATINLILKSKIDR